jgi:hypothetical protein
MLKVNGDKGEWVATAQKPCYGSAAASSSYARRDLRYAFTELLRGVDMCLTLDQFGELITCPIQEGDGATLAVHQAPLIWSCVLVGTAKPLSAGGRIVGPWTKPRVSRP